MRTRAGCLTLPQQENPSLANYLLSTTISENLAAELPDDDEAAAAILNSAIGYQLQLDTLEQDKNALKGYLNSLQQQRYVKIK